jgi:membrane-bound transcription factor site-1 protease
VKSIYSNPLVTYGSKIRGIGLNGGINILSGTSKIKVKLTVFGVACPVVTGALALLLSSTNQKWNVGSMKQILHESSDPLRNPSIYEQGSGKLNLLKAHDLLKSYKPKFTSYPKALDLTNLLDGCKYMWPFCSQPSRAMFLIV